MSIVTKKLTAPSRVELHNVSWATFEALSLEASGGRFAYDQGTLVIMSPSYNHEVIKWLIGRLIETYTEELDIVLNSSGSTTLKRKDLQKGIEADESYYLANAHKIQGNKEIELPHDPPPDLVIEVDITNSSRRKLTICRSLGVPEVWRYYAEKLEGHVLNADQQYELRSESSVLPEFPLATAMKLLAQHDSLNANQMVRQFRASISEENA